MMATLAFPSVQTRDDPDRETASVLIACPDARPPAYQAVVGLARAGLLDQFVTGFYYHDSARLAVLARQWAPCAYAKWRRLLRRRHHPEVPPDRVRSRWDFDVSLRAETLLANRSTKLRHRLARRRTDRFDQAVAKFVDSSRPEVAFVFSDVGSRYTLPTCREQGVRTVLSMVHGDVREERNVLALEAERSPDFYPIYLADGPIDWAELNWLHERRLQDIALADRVLVPSEHIANWLVRHGTPIERVRVVPYAADTSRFAPRPNRSHDPGTCTFLFTGGITQRKGIKYLLEAWRRVRRPGWRLQLLGGLPANTAPLEAYRDDVEWLGRVGHAEVPRIMAEADVFVFPSLFEGSAVVTYEALACGLPSVVTAASGSVARHGVEALVVPSAEVEPLAQAMERLGSDPRLREDMGRLARRRAEEFDWARYHAAIIENVLAHGQLG